MALDLIPVINLHKAPTKWTSNSISCSTQDEPKASDGLWTIFMAWFLKAALINMFILTMGEIKMCDMKV